MANPSLPAGLRGLRREASRHIGAGVAPVMADFSRCYDVLVQMAESMTNRKAASRRMTSGVTALRASGH